MSIISSSKLPEMPFTHFLKPPFRQPLFFLKPFSSSPSSSFTKPSFQTPPPASQTSSSSWIKQWPSPLNSGSHSQHNAVEKRAPKTKDEAGASAIDRIVLRLRNLGLGSDDEDEDEEEVEEEEKKGRGGADGGEKLGDLLKREWVRPDMILGDEEEGEDEGGVLPWEREEREERRRLRRAEEEEEEGGGARARKRVVRAPSLAELTIEDGELRRLRKDGMVLRERVSVPKAGVTNAVLEAIHEKWRRNELVRLKFHEILARDMRTAHEIVEVVRYEFVF